MILRTAMQVSAGMLCLLAISCGGPGFSTANSPQRTSTAGNVQPISIGLGPNGNYANGLFTDVTICTPGTANCQTINNVLVDTGSSGLRLLGTVVSIPLPDEISSDGNTILECLPFISGYTWGPVRAADVTLAQEKASGIPVQILDESQFPVAGGCKSSGLPSQDSVQKLGANGILGVGEFAHDCGVPCGTGGSSNPGLYYACNTSGCEVTAESMAQQVQNPVVAFQVDNNGVEISLPAVTFPQVTATGSLIFGIGTESNNGLGSARVYTTDEFGNFTTKFNGHSYPGSFIDSGSNGFFFLDPSTTGIQTCLDANGFYCPASTEDFSAENDGLNGTEGRVSFSVANADTLFSTSVDAAFSNLAGPSPGVFDWGVPFFFGRTVFTAIEGRNTPAGKGAYWAY